MTERQPGFDPSTKNIFDKKLALKILWDEVDGKKTNPHVDVPEFFIGGFGFRLTIRPKSRQPTVTLLVLKLSKTSLAVLASGFQIDVSAICKWNKTVRGSLRYATWQRNDVMTADRTINSLLKESRFPEEVVNVELKMKFHDIFPYRLHYVEAEMAKKNWSDAKIVLVDDEDKEVYANKTVLAMRSSFFRAYFFDNFKEKDEDVMKLEGIKEEDFLEYLYCVDAMPARPLDFKRIEMLLNLSNRFENLILKVMIEEFLMCKAKTPMEKVKTLILADANNMPAVFKKNLAEMEKDDLKWVDDEAISKLKREHLVLLVAHFRDLP